MKLFKNHNKTKPKSINEILNFDIKKEPDESYTLRKTTENNEGEILHVYYKKFKTKVADVFDEIFILKCNNDINTLTFVTKNIDATDFRHIEYLVNSFNILYGKRKKHRFSKYDIACIEGGFWIDEREWESEHLNPILITYDTIVGLECAIFNINQY